VRPDEPMQISTIYTQNIFVVVNMNETEPFKTL